MRFEFADTVLLPFPFTSLATTKQRPAVIVSNAAYNRAKPDIVLMAITSQFRPTPALGEVWIDQWQAAGLVKPSAIKPILATIEQSMVIRRLGRLAAIDQNALKKALDHIIG